MCFSATASFIAAAALTGIKFQGFEAGELRHGLHSRPDSSVSVLTPTVIAQSYETLAGYMVEDPAALFVDTLTWLPDDE